MFDGLSPETGYHVVLRLLHGLAVKLFHDYEVESSNNLTLIDCGAAKQLKSIEQKFYNYLKKLKKGKEPSSKQLNKYRVMCDHISMLVSNIENPLYRAAVKKLFSCYSLILTKMTLNSPSYRTYPAIYNNIFPEVLQAMLLHELFVRPSQTPEQHAENVKNSVTILLG